jgi:NTE family protein
MAAEGAPPPTRGRTRRRSSFKTALVLAGGAARGSYEVGVVDYVLTSVAKTLGARAEIDVLCGTSVGAINACVIAAYADDPILCSRVLLSEWLGLRLEELVRLNTSQFLGLLSPFSGRRMIKDTRGGDRRGGLLDPSGIERIVRRAIPFDRIEANIASGLLTGLTLSTTHVATGRTVIYVQHHPGARPKWSHDPTIRVVPGTLGAEHALASGALPLLFPAVRIDGDFYCDGGLRQNVPLSPARRLGADGLIVVNPRFIPPHSSPPKSDAPYPGPLFLLGKALNALLLDRIDNDLDRLRRINAILEAGIHRYGPTFLTELNLGLSQEGAGAGLRPLLTVHIRTSQDIGALAAEYVRSREFSARTPGVLGRALRRIAEWQGEGEADLLSYLLFDGGFAAQLIELGRSDAKARHDELCAFFARAME